MTQQQLDALIEFIRAAAWDAAAQYGCEPSPSSSRKEEKALRESFETRPAP